MKDRIFIIRKINKNKPLNKIWTKEEDFLLLNFIENSKSKKMSRLNWKNFSNILITKTNHQCYKRFDTINPKLKKGRWTHFEDELLKKSVNLFGKSWSLISKLIKIRSEKQIKNRYENYLDPKLDLDKFKSEEDSLILNIHEKFGNKWSKYSKYLPNRSIKNIKRRYLRIKNLNQL